uniref:Uncharacterized protein n=1 Tax=Caenorhabditis japonica TaxID=281687 RepID=A0A8R1IIR8_CAEJA
MVRLIEDMFQPPKMAPNSLFPFPNLNFFVKNEVPGSETTGNNEEEEGEEEEEEEEEDDADSSNDDRLVYGFWMVLQCLGTFCEIEETWRYLENWEKLGKTFFKN